MTNDSKPSTHVRTRDELVKETGEQLHAIRELMICFESGGQWAGKLLATIIHMLCHDGWGKSKSIISQLGYRTRLTCITTAVKIDPKAFVQSPPTLGFSGNGWIPRCAMLPREHFIKIPFEEWWSEPVFVDNGRILTRKDLILELRCRDGAGHVDTSIDNKEYLSLKNGGGWVVITEDRNDLPSQPLHLLVTYTIAWELYNSFVEAYAWPRPVRAGSA